MFDSTRLETRPKLMTIGYEGTEISDFISTLKAAGVRSLVDVRELPLSRKKGLSNRALCEAVKDAGMSYIHVRQLGDPKPGRDAARSGNMRMFRVIFGEHMKRVETCEALQDLMPIVADGGACLLCFERCHSGCHRSILAEELRKMMQIDILHIHVVHGIEQGN